MEVFFLDSKGTVCYEKGFKVLNPSVPTWIRLVKPSIEEMTHVSESTKIPLEEFVDFLEDEERSRMEKSKYIQIVYRTPAIKNDDVTTTSFSVFFNNSTFVTVERENTTVLEQIASKMKAGKLKLIFKKSAGFFVYHLIDKVNDEFLTSIQKIGNLIKRNRIDYAETSEANLISIYNANVTLAHYSSALIANRDLLNILRKSNIRMFTKIDYERFEDLYNDTLQIIDSVKISRDVLSNLFNFQSILASHRLNNFMKRLTALALIVAVPTLISSIYGMNVDLPLDKSPFAFFFLFLLMMIISIGGYFFMKKKGWI